MPSEMNQGSIRWQRVYCMLALSFFSPVFAAGDGADIDVDWLHDIDVTLLHNNNIGQAPFTRDEVESTAVFASYGLLSNIEIDDDRAVTLKAFIEGQHVENVSDLSSSSIGAQVVYRWQPIRGYLKPFYQVNASVQKDNYGTSQRDSTVFKAQFFATRRMTDKLTMVAGVEHFSQDAKDAVFDVNHNRVFFNLDYQASEMTNLYSTYSFRKGEINSVAQSIACDGSTIPGVSLLVAESIVRGDDLAFENEFCGRWVSYKLDADTHVVSLGVNRAVGLASAVDISLRQVESDASGGISYSSTIIAASYLVRL